MPAADAVDAAAGFECQQCLADQPHVVDAEDLHALAAAARHGAGGRRRRGRRPCRPAPCRGSPCASGRPAAGSPARGTGRRLAISVRLCWCVLPKPMPGSRQIRSRSMPAASSASRRSRRYAQNLRDDVVVARDRPASSAACLACASHRRRRRLRRPAAASSRIAQQAGDVVDDLGAGVRCAARRRRLCSCRSRSARRFARRSRSITGSTRRSSSSASTGVGIGPRALAADVEQVGAVGDQLQGVVDGGLRIEELARRRKSCRA